MGEGGEEKQPHSCEFLSLPVKSYIHGYLIHFMKIFAGLIPFKKMPEFKILIKLAKWYLDMPQPLRRTLSHMHSVALLRSQNCLSTRTNFEKKKYFLAILLF